MRRVSRRHPFKGGGFPCVCLMPSFDKGRIVKVQKRDPINIRKRWKAMRSLAALPPLTPEPESGESVSVSVSDSETQTQTQTQENLSEATSTSSMKRKQTDDAPPPELDQDVIPTPPQASSRNKKKRVIKSRKTTT